MHQDEQELFSAWEGCHWDDSKDGWLDLELCAKARREEVEYIRRHKMYVRVPRVRARSWKGPHPRQGGRRPTRDSQGSFMCARWVAKECKTHARPELYASSTPLEALKVVLFEIATGEREGKVLYWHWSTCGGRISTLPHEEKYLSNCRPRTTSLVTNTRVDCYGPRDAAQNWEEELASTLSGRGLTRRSACPCVWRGRMKGEDVVATVHGDDITIGGQRTAVEFLIKMISKKV